MEELVATLCTFGITILWLGPCEVVLIWAFFNCFGLNFELWTTKFFSMEPFASFEVCLSCYVSLYTPCFMYIIIIIIFYFFFFFFLQTAMSEANSRRIRAIFNTFNFWSIVFFNILALRSLDFAKLVAKRLLLKGAIFFFFVLERVFF